ncbi:MAG: hypothetical protein SAL07_19675 [Oscillatoria sp. PMC 1051.18]|nr:hypothetical protein [Oscillatoria sp. PMC 1050.18]MEC5032123.1 hypothetical protein [Oscillatoria sp. PMC 1051.18]
MNNEKDWDEFDRTTPFLAEDKIARENLDLIFSELADISGKIGEVQADLNQFKKENDQRFDKVIEALNEAKRKANDYLL